MSIANRANTILLVLILAVGVGIVAMLASGAYGGPLDPPGPPSSTPGGIDGRIPIDHLPFTISQSGSYFVTKNLTGDGTNDGITVAISNVTIDLNGFTLSGVGKTHVGIHTAQPLAGISIAHGVVTLWDFGVQMSNSTGGTIRDLEASLNNNGIYAAPESIVSDCIVRANDNVGLSVSLSRVTGCVIAESGVTGLTAASAIIERNLIQNNGTQGVSGVGALIYGETTLKENVFESNQGLNLKLAGSGNTVADNQLSNLVFPDIQETSADNIIVRNHVTSCSSIISIAGSYVPIAKISGSASTAVGLVNTNIALNPSGAGLC